MAWKFLGEGVRLGALGGMRASAACAEDPHQVPANALEVAYLIGPEENELANDIVPDIKGLDVLNQRARGGTYARHPGTHMVDESRFNAGLDVVPADQLDEYNDFLDSLGIGG